MKRSSHVARELAAYFASSPTAIRSSWGTMVDAAMSGGFGGTRDPEAKLLGGGGLDITGRFDRGRLDLMRGTMRRDARARAALLTLCQADQRMLFAAHGPFDWPRRLSDAVANGETAYRVVGRLFGPMLCTGAIARAAEHWSTAPLAAPQAPAKRNGSARPRVHLGPEEHALVAMAFVAGTDARAGAWLADAKSEAVTRLRLAESAYDRARAATDAGYTAEREREEREEAQQARRIRVRRAPSLIQGGSR